jgi:hypothetical protein
MFLNIVYYTNKRQRKPKGQLKKDNTEKLTTLGTQDTWGTKKTQHRKLRQDEFSPDVICVFLFCPRSANVHISCYWHKK